MLSIINEKLMSPMLASIGDRIPGKGWVYELKYDGIRVLAAVTRSDIYLITRNHNDKSFQFPEIVDALTEFYNEIEVSVILDGEIVAVRDGKPTRFQTLQSRINETDSTKIFMSQKDNSAWLLIFDILFQGETSTIDLPWTKRRERLKSLFAHAKNLSPVLQLTSPVAETGKNEGEKLLKEAEKQGWEGIIAKRVDKPYVPGRRTAWWQKLKLERRQEFVIGGFTDPRRSRPYFGSLMVGYYEGDKLIYAGHVGTGFSVRSLREIHSRLSPLVQKECPFNVRPIANERPHWVKPELIAEVKFTQWTEDGRLRTPVFLGLRDDKTPKEITLEAQSMQRNGGGVPDNMSSEMATRSKSKTTHGSVLSSRTSQLKYGEGAVIPSKSDVEEILRQLQEAEGEGKVTIDFGDGRSLEVSNLDKVYFPRDGITKREVLEYYCKISSFILPVVADRPIVLRRFPEGIAGEGFYQHQVTDPPPAVRTEMISVTENERDQLVGGDLPTLFYAVQLGAVSVDPWHSRFPETDFADYSIIDLDPGSKASFRDVVQAALWVKEVMDSHKLHGIAKTSGATGIHIYLPLPESTTNEAAQLLAELIATQTTALHPEETTIERSVKERSASAVYVDYLQNIRGKTVVAPYSLRARNGAPVSTPLHWDELTSKLGPGHFTINTVLSRFESLGDLWAEQMSKPNSLKHL